MMSRVGVSTSVLSSLFNGGVTQAGGCGWLTCNSHTVPCCAFFWDAAVFLPLQGS